MALTSLNLFISEAFGSYFVEPFISEAFGSYFVEPFISEAFGSYFVEPFISEAKKGCLGYLSCRNLARHNINGILSNNNVLSHRLVKLGNRTSILLS